MPLRVIGAGFGRTGTLSLCTALNQLGFPCYHMFNILGGESLQLSVSTCPKESRLDLDFWHDVANGKPGTQHDWEKVFSEYASTAGPPQGDLWRELLSAYPDAKVVLTVHPRGADAWYESLQETIYQGTEAMWQFKVLQFATPSARKLAKVFRELVWQRSLNGTMSDRARAVARYHQHIDEVRASVPAEQLLVYSVDQGWKPLCAFLGVPEPAGEFPKVNERAALKQWISEFTRGAYLILAAFVLAVAGVIYGIARLFQ